MPTVTKKKIQQPNFMPHGTKTNKQQKTKPQISRRK